MSNTRKQKNPAEGLSAKGLSAQGVYARGLGKLASRIAAVALVVNASTAAALDFSDPADTVFGYTVTGFAGGVLTGFAVDSQNHSERKNTIATVASTALTGTLIGAGIGWWRAPKVRSQVDKAKAETKKLLEMDRNQGRFPMKDALANGPDRIKCEGNGEDIVSLCTDKNGDLGECELDNLGFKYLNSKVAVQFVMFASPNGCFQGPYNSPPELDKYFGKVFRQLNLQLKKDQ